MGIERDALNDTVADLNAMVQGKGYAVMLYGDYYRLINLDDVDCDVLSRIYSTEAELAIAIEGYICGIRARIVPSLAESMNNYGGEDRG